MSARDVVPSPNIWRSPEIYERENRAFDPDGLVSAAMRAVRDWVGAHVLDVGCGTGYHLPLFAATAARVTGVEPHPALLRLARRRTASLERVRVLAGSAAALPVPPASVDVVHARWAYFFGPGSERGLAEVDRVARRGAAAFVLDTDATRSTFGLAFGRALPGRDPIAVRRFWARRGWHREPVETRFAFASRADLAAVLAIELPEQQVREVLAETSGSTLDCAVDLYWRRF